MRTGSLFAILLLALSAAPACSRSTRPCSTYGDTEWKNKIFGDQICYHRYNKELGRWLSHGEYKVVDDDGNVLLKGSFQWGKKHGFWTQYTPEGKEVLTKYYEKGVEKITPKPVAEDPPRGYEAVRPKKAPKKERR